MEGAESRDALHNQAMENLFKNSQTMFLINTQHIKDINSILLPLTDIYVKYIQNQASKDIEQLPTDMKQQFSSLMNVLFMDKTKDTSITITHEESDALHEKLIHALSASYQLPKFIREMSFVYLVAKFDDFISKDLQIIFTKRREVLKPRPKKDKTKAEEKKVTYQEVYSASNLDELKDKIVERETKRILMQDLENRIKDLKRLKIVDLSYNKDNLKAIKECLQRRNILVHNNGRVDTTYRKKTGENPIEQYLTVDERYLMKSITLFETYCNEITARLLQKFANKKT